MKKLAIMTGALFSIFLIAGLAQSAEVVLGPHDNGKEVRVQAGEVLELTLEMQAGTGYLWEFHKLDGKHFELMQSETKPLPDQAKVGGPMLQVWRLKTRAPGEARLSLDYLRPWEGRARAIKHFEVRVHIQ